MGPMGSATTLVTVRRHRLGFLEAADIDQQKRNQATHLSFNNGLMSARTPAEALSFFR